MASSRFSFALDCDNLHFAMQTHQLKKIGVLVSESIANLPKRAERCFVDGGFIVFRLEDGTDYDIPLAQCDSYAKILAWQFHLSSKRWVTKDLLMQFTIIACDYHRLPIARR
jgi:hypothetical protein